MPFYEYRCERRHTFEVMQRMSDDKLTTCTACGAQVERVLQPVAVHFKGSGFYTTDYGKKKGAGSGESSSGDGAKSDGAKSDGASKKSDSDSGRKSESSAAKSGAAD